MFSIAVYAQVLDARVDTFFIFPLIGHGRVASWPPKNFLSTYPHGRVAANKTSTYFDRGSVAVWPPPLIKL